MTEHSPCAHGCTAQWRSTVREEIVPRTGHVEFPGNPRPVDTSSRGWPVGVHAGSTKVRYQVQFAGFSCSNRKTVQEALSGRNDRGNYGLGVSTDDRGACVLRIPFFMELTRVCLSGFARMKGRIVKEATNFRIWGMKRSRFNYYR